MKFVTNRIYTGKPTKTVNDLVKEAQAKNAGLSKIASASKEAQMSNFKGKEKAPFNSKGKSTKDDDKELEKEECMETEASKEVEIKVAEDKKKDQTSDGEKGVETYDAGKKEGTEFTNDDLHEPTDKDVQAFTGGDKKPEPKKGKDGLPESGQPQWEGKKENNNNPWKDPKAVDAGAKTTVKISVPKGVYVNVANMKPELKSRTREYWLALYPADYVDAMLSDK